MKSAHTYTHAYKHTSNKQCILFSGLLHCTCAVYIYKFISLYLYGNVLIKSNVPFTIISRGSQVTLLNQVYDGLGGNPTADLRNTRGSKSSSQPGSAQGSPRKSRRKLLRKGRLGCQICPATATLIWISGQEMNGWINGNKTLQLNKHSCCFFFFFFLPG